MLHLFFPKLRAFVAFLARFRLEDRRSKVYSILKLDSLIVPQLKVSNIIGMRATYPQLCLKYSQHSV